MRSPVLQLADFLVAAIQGIYLDDPRNKDLAFASTVRVSFDDYSGEDKPSIEGYIYLAVVGQPGGYKKVFAAFTMRPMAYTSVSWQLVTCHDTCWRSDGVGDALKVAFQAVLNSAETVFEKKATELSNYIAIENMKNGTLSEIFSGGQVPALPVTQFFVAMS